MALYSLTRSSGIPVLKVSGHMDLPDGEAFTSELTSLAEDKENLAIIADLSHLKRIGSAGMRALTLTHQRLAKRGARLIVTGLTGDVRETFQIARIDTLLELTDTVAQAVEICRAPEDANPISDHRRRRWAAQGR